MTVMYFPFRHFVSWSHGGRTVHCLSCGRGCLRLILSNLRPGFTRNVIPRINSSTAVSVSQANSGERQVNDEELRRTKVPFNPRRRRQPRAVLFKLGLPLPSRQLARTELVGKTLVEDQQSQSGPLSRPKAALPRHLFTRI